MSWIEEKTAPNIEISDIIYGITSNLKKTNFMYAVNSSNDSLYTIDIDTGVTTLIGSLGLSFDFGNALGLSTDASGNLFGIIWDSNPSNKGIYAINKTTGAGTLSINHSVGIPSSFVLNGSVAYMGRHDSRTIDEVDLSDGTIITTGNFVNGTSRMKGLAMRNGVLYGVKITNSSTFASLVTINNTSGSGSFGNIISTIGTFTVLGSFNSLAYLPDKDLFYTVNEDAGSALYSLSPTDATMTQVLASTGLPDQTAGLTGFTETERRTNFLHSVDLDAGTTSIKGDSGLNFDFNNILGLSIDAQGKLFALIHSTNSSEKGIYSVNRVTGVATLSTNHSIDIASSFAINGSVGYIGHDDSETVSEVNLSDGTIKTAGNTVAGIKRIKGLTMRNGVLYGLRVDNTVINNTFAELVTLDSVSGSGTFGNVLTTIGTFTIVGNFHSLAYLSDTDLFYSVNERNASPAIYSISPVDATTTLITSTTMLDQVTGLTGLSTRDRWREQFDATE